MSFIFKINTEGASGFLKSYSNVRSVGGGVHSLERLCLCATLTKCIVWSIIRQTSTHVFSSLI